MMLSVFKLVMAWLVDECLLNFVGMMLIGKLQNWEKNCPNVTLFTTEPILTGVRLNTSPLFSSFVYVQLLIVIRTYIFENSYPPR
jgi:hypothetical protein